jgi:PAS domain S-box-containing protein
MQPSDNGTSYRPTPLQQRFQVVTDSGALAMWEVELRSGRVTWSTHGESLLGLEPGREANTLEELMAFVHPDDRNRVARVLADNIAARASQSQERFRVVRADGTVRHVSTYVEFVEDDGNGPKKMVGFALDISDLAEYEERLRETDERLTTAYQAAKVWTWRLDLQSWTITRPLQTTDANSPQYGPSQAFEEWLTKVHPEDRARVEAGMRRSIATGELWEEEFRLCWPDGNYHWLYDRGQKVEIPGRVPFFSGAAMVIDERKSVEQQLVENEERLRSAYVAGKMWPWELEVASGNVKPTNEIGLYRGPGQSSSISLQEWLEGVHPEDRDRVKTTMELAIKEAGTYSCEYRLRWNDGSYHWLNSRGGLIRDTRGTLKLMGIARDCTEEKATAKALEESERLRLVALEAAQMGVFFQNMQTGEVRWSDRQFTLYGITREQFNNTREDFHRLVFSEDLEAMATEHQRLIEKREKKFRFEFRIKRPSDGKVRWLSAVGEMSYDDRGSVTTMMGVNYDITESKLHDHELRASEKLRSIAIGAAEMGVWRQDLATGKVTWTERQFELFGVSPEEFDGTPATAFQRMHPDDRNRLVEECNDVVTAHGSRHVTEFRIQNHDGTVRWLAAVGEILYDDTGESLQSVGVNFDITARKQQEEALRESERLRRLALSAAHMGAFEWNTVTGEITWSPEQYELLHLNPHDFIPTLDLFESRVHPEDLPRMQLMMQLLVGKQERRYRNEFRILWPDGTVRWIRTLGEFVYGTNGNVVRMYGVNWDVTDQKETEQHIVQLNRELQHRVADFEALMHAMPVAVAVGHDPESKDIRVNPTFAQLLGVSHQDQNVSIADRSRSELPFRVVRDGKDIPIEELPLRKAARLNQEIRNEEFEVITDQGRHIDMFGHAVPILDELGAVRGSLGAFMDITERKRAEQALRTGEKLATAGKMAASLAHEINNPLAAVTNLLYLIAQDESASENSKRFIAMATGELARVSQITRNILAFYRESNQPTEVDIAELTANVLELYSPKIRESRVEIGFERGEPCKVVAFPGELRQVFSNLIVNAIDAMPTGGKLRIRVHEGSDRRANRRGVRLVVSDTGVGIPRDKLGRLFEPFFTTKGEKGTGLGLWVSRDIINKHDGTIQIRTSSTAGRSGTCFSLFLPADSVSVRKRVNRNAASMSSHS